jgi:drug/metabolite transporter (DMT)-like permease
MRVFPVVQKQWVAQKTKKQIDCFSGRAKITALACGFWKRRKFKSGPEVALRPMNNKTASAHAALFAVALIYALNYSIAKEVMPQYLQPQAFIFLRVVGASALFWLFTAFRKFEKIAWRDVPLFFACGLFGVALNQMLFFEGLNQTSPINAAIIMTTTPILVLLLAAALNREGLRPAKILGVVLGAMGAIYLISAGRNATGFRGWGDFLVFLNAASFALYLVIVRPLMLRYKPMTVINWVFFFGMLVAVPFGWTEIQTADFESFPAHVWWKIAFVIVAVTFLTYLFNTFALKYVSATVVSSYIYLQPLLAAAIAIAWGSDALTGAKVVAAGLIFTGLYLVAIKR